MVGWIGCLSAKASYMSTGQKVRAVKHVTRWVLTERSQVVTVSFAMLMMFVDKGAELSRHTNQAHV